MKIFCESETGALLKCEGAKEYYAGMVTDGGYSSTCGFWCHISLPDIRMEVGFERIDPDVYPDIRDAYLSGEEIGFVFNHYERWPPSSVGLRRV